MYNILVKSQTLGLESDSVKESGLQLGSGLGTQVRASISSAGGHVLGRHLPTSSSGRTTACPLLARGLLVVPGQASSWEVLLLCDLSGSGSLCHGLQAREVCTCAYVYTGKVKLLITWTFLAKMTFFPP